MLTMNPKTGFVCIVSSLILFRHFKSYDKSIKSNQITFKLGKLIISWLNLPPLGIVALYHQFVLQKIYALTSTINFVQ